MFGAGALSVIAIPTYSLLTPQLMLAYKGSDINDIYMYVPTSLQRNRTVDDIDSNQSHVRVNTCIYKGTS